MLCWESWVSLGLKLVSGNDVAEGLAFPLVAGVFVARVGVEIGEKVVVGVEGMDVMLDVVVTRVVVGDCEVFGVLVLHTVSNVQSL